MSKRATLLLLASCVLACLFSTACVECVGVSGLAAGPPVPQIAVGGVIVERATLPDGSPSDTLQVADRFPSGGDGVNEIWVGWSETEAGPADFASIEFPTGAFGPGPRRVVISAGHYNSCGLRAVDAGGAPIVTVNHTAGQNTSQTLTLSGGNIARSTSWARRSRSGGSATGSRLPLASLALRPSG